MSEEQQVDEKLKELWRESSRDMAVAFLRRAIQPDMSLQALQAALAFDAVNPQLEKIRLSEVLSRPVAVVPRAAARPAPAARGGVRRKRAGGPRLRSEMKRIVLEALSTARNPIASPDLGRVLKGKGHPTDATKTYQLLKSMEEAGYLTSEGDRPKVWKITNKGREQIAD